MAKTKTKDAAYCCRHPLFAVILLVIGVLWILSDMGVITLDVPWLPLVVVVYAMGKLYKMHYHRCC
jgi:hypothetical protein